MTVLPPQRLHATFFIRLMLFPSSEFFLMDDVFFFFLSVWKRTIDSRKQRAEL